MPTFTNTELIAGTHTTAAQQTVEPADVAAAVVKVLDRPTTATSVPGMMRYLAAASSVLPTGARRWLSHRLGNDRVFLDFDRTTRAGYEQRAEGSTGID
jgi:hypothetical protein